MLDFLSIFEDMCIDYSVLINMSVVGCHHGINKLDCDKEVLKPRFQKFYESRAMSSRVLLIVQRYLRGYRKFRKFFFFYLSCGTCFSL